MFTHLITALWRDKWKILIWMTVFTALNMAGFYFTFLHIHWAGALALLMTVLPVFWVSEASFSDTYNLRALGGAVLSAALFLAGVMLCWVLFTRNHFFTLVFGGMFVFAALMYLSFVALAVALKEKRGYWSGFYHLFTRYGEMIAAMLCFELLLFWLTGVLSFLFSRIGLSMAFYWWLSVPFVLFAYLAGSWLNNRENMKDGVLFQCFSGIWRDKWKLLVWFAVYGILRALMVWMPLGALKIAAYASVLGTLGGLVYSYLFAYWAAGVKITGKSLRPVYVWGGLALLYGVGCIFNWWSRLFQSTISNPSSFCAIFGGTCMTFLYVTAHTFLALSYAPVIAAVQNKTGYWSGVYNLFLRHPFKSTAWAGAVLAVGAVGAGASSWLRLSVSLGGERVYPQMVFVGLCGFAFWCVGTYFFTAWLKKIPAVKPIAAQNAPRPAAAMERGPVIHITPGEAKRFFEVLLGRDLTQIRQLLDFEPGLAKVVWPDTGNTPLHVAAWNGWMQEAAVLLAADPSAVSAKNAAGKSPSALAQEQGHEALALELQRLENQNKEK